MPDIRITQSELAEERIAAAAVSAFRRTIGSQFHGGYVNQFSVDYADVRDAVKQQVRKELIRARIAEAKECGHPERVVILEAML